MSGVPVPSLPAPPSATTSPCTPFDVSTASLLATAPTVAALSLPVLCADMKYSVANLPAPGPAPPPPPPLVAATEAWAIPGVRVGGALPIDLDGADAEVEAAPRTSAPGGHPFTAPPTSVYSGPAATSSSDSTQVAQPSAALPCGGTLQLAGMLEKLVRTRAEPPDAVASVHSPPSSCIPISLLLPSFPPSSTIYSCVSYNFPL